MSDAVVIDPVRLKGEPQLPPLGILCVNPAEAAQAKQISNSMGGRQHFLYNSSLFVTPPDSGNEIFLAGSAVGAPMAVMVLEKLIALGARQVLMCGWCGALSPDLAIGDVLLPTWAVSEEGTSGHYPLTSRPESDRDLRSWLNTYLSNQGFPTQEGPIWTTDAPYRETRAKVRDYGAQGILGVDMEFSGLCTVAAFRGIELAAALLVSDEVWRPEWQPGFLGKSFKKKSRQFFQALVEFCRTTAPSGASEDTQGFSR